MVFDWTCIGFKNGHKLMIRKPVAEVIADLKLAANGAQGITFAHLLANASEYLVCVHDLSYLAPMTEEAALAKGHGPAR